MLLLDIDVLISSRSHSPGSSPGNATFARLRARHARGIVLSVSPTHEVVRQVCSFNISPLQMRKLHTRELRDRITEHVQYNQIRKPRLLPPSALHHAEPVVTSWICRQGQGTWLHPLQQKSIVYFQFLVFSIAQALGVIIKFNFKRDSPCLLGSRKLTIKNKNKAGRPETSSFFFFLDRIAMT